MVLVTVEVLMHDEIPVLCSKLQPAGAVGPSASAGAGPATVHATATTAAVAT